MLELWLKGRVALLRETVVDTNAAIDAFEQARDLDPRNPLPWLGLADAYSRLAYTWDPEGDWHERASAMCERALQLDPNIAEGRYMRARLAWTPQRGFDHAFAIAEIAETLAERPNFNEAWDLLGVILFHVGLLDDARLLADRALAISPGDPLVTSHIAWLETIRGNHREALRYAAQRATEGRAAHPSYLIALNLMHLDDLAGAEKVLEEAARKYPGLVLNHSARGIAAALRRNEGAARHQIELTLQNRKAYGHFHHAEFDIGCALALLGHRDEAIEWLAAAVRDGFPCLLPYEQEPFLASLRGEPAYVALLDELRQTRDRYARLFDGVRQRISSAS